jgi:hypothetical protein
MPRPPRSLQVLALAVGGASIVTYNFGQLITVRGLSQVHLTNQCTDVLAHRACTALASAWARCTACRRFA